MWQDISNQGNCALTCVEAFQNGINNLRDLKGNWREKAGNLNRLEMEQLFYDNKQRTGSTYGISSEQHSRIFFFSHPSRVLTQASPGDLQSLDMNGIVDDPGDGLGESGGGENFFEHQLANDEITRKFQVQRTPSPLPHNQSNNKRDKRWTPIDRPISIYGTCESCNVNRPSYSLIAKIWYITEILKV